MRSYEPNTKWRLCALCQQFYDSGLRDNVASSDVLHARRMLIERGSATNEREIRVGIELFLDELTKQRELESNQHLPLDVCAFCAQFLPSAYQGDKLVDDFRSQVLLGSARGASRGGALPHQGRQHQQATGASSAKRAYGSSLVIQHQFAKLSPPAAATGPAQRPKSSSGALSPPASSASSVSYTSSSSGSSASTAAPREPAKPSYRLLTNDITRVLRIESPRGAISIGGASLTASDVMQNLQSQEKHQTAAILRSTRAKQDARFRQRIHSLELQAAISLQSRPENIVHAIRASGAGADSLYTGAVVSSPSSKGAKDLQRLAKPSVTSFEATKARIKTQRNGRHFKTELLFPPL